MMGYNFLGAKYQHLVFNLMGPSTSRRDHLNVTPSTLLSLCLAAFQRFNLAFFFKGQNYVILVSTRQSYFMPLSVTLLLGHVELGRACFKDNERSQGWKDRQVYLTENVVSRGIFLYISFSSKVADQLWKEKQPLVAIFFKLSEMPKY